jgi:hypothetical protein
LRRENRIRTIQASLAIENNTLTLEQVTAVIEGKRVLGHPREIQEVRNAFATYEAMEEWQASSENDLLTAHELLMHGLVDETGRYRSGGVGIYRGEQLVHMAPPADLVPKLMADLLDWLANTNEHPLVASCIFHYEFEFIHPFADGKRTNGTVVANPDPAQLETSIGSGPHGRFLQPGHDYLRWIPGKKPCGDSFSDHFQEKTATIKEKSGGCVTMAKELSEKQIKDGFSRRNLEHIRHWYLFLCRGFFKLGHSLLPNYRKRGGSQLRSSLLRNSPALCRITCRR